MRNVTRRDFFKLAASGCLGLSGLLGLGALLRYLGYSTEAHAPDRYDLGPAAAYPPDSRTLIAAIPALLVHGREGFTALRLVCPHLGCTVSAQADGFVCPCHGSEYDQDGRVLRGPAEQSLKILQVEQDDDGRVIIHLD